MSENLPNTELAVDRREEIVRTQQPGYASTQQVTRDVAAESRLRMTQITRIMWTIAGILEILLGLRFMLKLIAANPGSGFAGFIYGITGVFTAPFNTLLGTPASSGGSILEVTTLIAMAVYALFFWVVARVIVIATERTSARTTSRSVSEQTPGGPGNERTTHTISS